jgi:DNA repair exonuclease SbcCD ATPase subunit
MDYGDINIYQGKNGSGKSTLAVDAVLFALYGYSRRKLADLPRKGHSSSCMVSINIKVKNDVFKTRFWKTALKKIKRFANIK